MEELIAALSAGDPKIAKILNDTNLLNPADVQQVAFNNVICNVFGHESFLRQRNRKAMASEQIKQRKQENPHQIDKVPI